jgi:hypothetical protein
MSMDSDPSAPTLNALKQEARKAHHAATFAEKSALRFAMEAGDHLLEILNRKLVGHGQKKTLFEEVCDSVRTAQVYIQLAEGRALIEAEANAQRAAPLSIREALKLLQQHANPPEPKDDGTPTPPKPKAKPAITIAAWQAMAPEERTKLLDDIGREQLCKAMSPALAAEIAKHILGQHNQLTGGRKKSAADKQIGALAARRTGNVIELPVKH